MVITENFPDEGILTMKKRTGTKGKKGYETMRAKGNGRSRSRSSMEVAERLCRKAEDSGSNVALAVADEEEREKLAENEDYGFSVVEDDSDDTSFLDDKEAVEAETASEYDTDVIPRNGAGNEDLIRLYFKDIGKIPLISQDEVIRLAKIIERARKRKDKATVTKAKKKLVSANLRLVISIAKKFSNCGMPLLDLIQAGNIGLMKAVDGFDYKLGFRFSTYASKWIQAAITRTISNQVRTIRIPVNVIPALRRVDRTNRKLARELGRKPTTQEVSSDSGVEVEKVQSMARIPQRAISLDFPIDGDNGDCTLEEVLGDTRSPATAEIVNRHFFRDELEKVMGEALDPREREVLRLRYGLEDGTEHTQSDIAEHLSLSRQRVSQIENKALLRLRNHMGEQAFRSFLN